MRPTDPVAADPSRTVAMPDDWPDLWEELIQRRETHDVGNAVRPVPCSEASAPWLELYRPLLSARQTANLPGARPWVVAQLGQSLDGCIATSSGDSYFVTGPESLLHLHRLRALCDGVLVGAGTVAADDPQLTTRRVPGPHPVRVVLDPSARLDGRAKVLSDGGAPTLWLCDLLHAGAARERLRSSHAQVLAVEGLIEAQAPSRRFRLDRAFSALATYGLQVLLVEGGGVTVSRCLEARLVDRLHLVVAPLIIGSGRPGLQVAGPARMADCLRPSVRRMALGEDQLWDLDLSAASSDRGSPP